MGNATPTPFRVILAIALLLLPACQNKDTRLTLEQYWDDVAQDETAAAAAATQPAPADPGQFGLKEKQPYRVGAGDVLAIELIGVESDYSRTELTLRVHPDGSVIMPLVGHVRVHGQELAGVEAAIIDAYVPDFLPRLSCYVKVATPGETTVVIMGPATSQGVVTLPRDERNVLYALGKAGGVNPATTGGVVVRRARDPRAHERYDLTRIDDLQRALLSPPLESGDMIVIEPAATSRIFVTGLVNTPGPLEVPKDSSLSLVRAVSASGGLVDFLAPSDATLWRQLRNGHQVRVKVPLGDIMNGDQPDLALLPGDVLEIPHTSETRLRQWVLENIRIGPFGVTAVYDPVADYRARVLADDDENENVFIGGLQSSLDEAFNQALLRSTLTP